MLRSRLENRVPHTPGGNHAEIVARRHRQRRGTCTFIVAAAGRAKRRRPAARQRHFKTSCNEVAQRRFDRAMRYQHSFWYLNAKEVFEEALKADPTCAIAQWGIALTLLDNPHNAIPQSNLAPGLAAIQKAKAMDAKTERERDYIDALMLMYADHDKLSHAQRIRAFRDAQEKIAAKYPDDDEAQIAYAITLNTSADLNDKTYAQQTKGAAILEPISQRLPRHPGVTHYLIHLYDYPETAAKGSRRRQPLRQGRAGRAARPAHAVAHLHPRRLLEGVDRFQHRLGEGSEGREVGRQLSARPGLHGLCPPPARPGQAGARRHGRDDARDRFQSDRVGRPLCAGGLAGALCGRARRLERRVTALCPAERLQLRGGNLALCPGARRRRSGKPEAAKADIAKLAELRDKLREAKDAYWSEIVDIQRQVAAAWVLHAEGKYDEALKAMSAAADAEDKTEKHAVTPGPLAPARELYGFMLLERGMAKEALAAFEATKAKEPNRYHGFAGAAQAADKLGDKAKAKDNYQKLIALAANGRFGSAGARGRSQVPGEQLGRAAARLPVMR